MSSYVYDKNDIKNRIFFLTINFMWAIEETIIISQVTRSPVYCRNAQKMEFLYHTYNTGIVRAWAYVCV